jgi:hypothetical protein
MTAKLDALVVRAGPVGVSTAAALLAQGLRVRIQNHYRRIITPYVVLPEKGPAAKLGVDVLFDVEGQFAQHYAASVLYLVRPDGYIAFRCLAAKQNLLESYIDKYFVPL